MPCPVCRAADVRGPQCRRCKADLGLLQAVEDRRRQALAEARRCLARAEYGPAAAQAQEADGLRHDAESQRLLAVVHLMRSDFAGAWRCYQGGVARFSPEGAP